MFRDVLNRCAAISLAAVVAATPLLAQEFDVPSGQPVTLQEVFLEAQDDSHFWLRARFISPDIGDSNGFEKVADDFAYLCATYVIPLLENEARTVDLVVISFADRAIEFGETDPAVTQFFEAYRLENGVCIWEGF